MSARSVLVAHVRGTAGLRASNRRLALAAAAAACLAVLHAQQTPPPQAPPQQLPQFRAEANLVRVDAYVAAAGHPVEDLRAGDFDILEDNVRQKVETFEFVRGGQVLTGRAPDEPERRGRMFVLFVDTYHLPWVDRDVLEHRGRTVPTWQMEPLRFPVVLPPPIPDDGMFRDALKEVVNRVVGDDDRIAVLTPDMWAASLTFMEKQAAVEELATRTLEPYTVGQRPPELNRFEACFPQGPNVEAEMRLRYRLFRTFTALQELVANLELVREERKALLLVTRGWDPPPRIRNYRDPRSGMIGQDDSICHAERLALADRDFDAWFRTIISDAKRSNVAFYSVYAHPLVTYEKADADIDEDTRQFQRQWGDAQGMDSGQRMLVDGFPAILRDRNMWHEALKELSKDTNGRAILTKDDFEKGLKDISDTLSSYYLLGYYSTNTKRDGNFRKITVNVNRKGVTVRARPGYRAVIPAELEAAELANRPDAVPPVITAALAPLARLRSDVPFHLAAAPERDQVSAGWRVRVIGEIDSARARDPEWRNGWRAELTLTAADGKLAGSADVTAKGGQAAFSTTLPTSGLVGAGDYEVRAKAYGSDKETILDARTPVSVPAAAGAGAQLLLGRPLLLRRPNVPRSEFQPTADQRFNRREILRIEVPVTAGVDAPSLRLVDRKGQGLGSPIPATVTERDGGRIASGTIVLSNVAPGDYVIEIAASDKTPDGKVYVAFRVVP
jgi:VWFA-related protein